MFGSRAASRVTENGGFGPLCPPGLFMSFSSLHASLPLFLILSSLRFLLQIDQGGVHCSRSDNSSDAQGFQLNLKD